MITAPIEFLRAIYNYDSTTGGVTRRIARGGQLAGAVVGYLRKDGYLGTKVGGAEVLMHRLAWAIHFGEWPEGELDHKNTVRSANWIDNLRPSTRLLNNQNRRKAHRNNRLGVHGVHQIKSGRYQARIRVNGKAISLGAYATAAEAGEVFIAAKRAMHPGSTL